MKARTEILYSTSSSKFSRSKNVSFVVLLAFPMSPSNVSNGVYSISYAVRTPFMSMSATFSHSTSIVVDD